MISGCFSSCIRLIYLGKEGVAKQIQETAENLVPHEQRRVEVGDGERASIHSGVWPVARHGEAKHNDVDSEGNRE